MLKRSLLNISFVSVGNIFNAFLGLAFVAAVAKTLPIDGFGKYALLTSLLVFLSKIMDFGTNSVFVAKSIAKTESLFNRFVSLKIILFIVTIPISAAVLYMLGLLQKQILILFIFGLTGYCINYTFFAIFQKLEKFHYAILLNTLPALIKGSFAILIFLNIVTFNLTQSLTVFSLSILASTFLYLFVPNQFRKFKFSPQSVFSLFVFSFPAGVSILINEGWLALSNTIVKISKTFTDVGIFSLANKIANVFSLISLSIFTVLLPKNALRKREQLRYDFRETAILSLGILVFAVITTFFAKLFVSQIFGQKFEDSLSLLDILIFASAITAIHTFIENYFFVEEKTQIILIITTSKLITYIILATILIPLYSLQGLAFASLISAFTALLITSIVLIKDYKKH